MDKLLPLDIFVDCSQLLHSSVFAQTDALELIGGDLSEILDRILADVGCREGPVLLGEVKANAVIEGRVYLEKGAVIEPGAYVKGPCYIGAGAEVRHCAYIRGKTYVGPNAVVGHTTEVKNSIFFDGAKAGHFAYIGDSILGRDCNLGAGTKLANLKLQGNLIKVKSPTDGKIVTTNLRKMGAVIGDLAQTGCNAVCSPGSLMMPSTSILPCQHWHGTKMS